MQQHVFLELSDITVRYGDVEALSGVGVEICRGEIVGVIGENGAGKTTLLNIIAGVFAPEGGSMRVDGQAYRPRTPADADRLGIVSVMNTPNLVGTLSVAENVMHDRYPRNRLGMIDWRRLFGECRRLFQELDIPIDPSIPADRLGMREKRLVELVRAYHSGAQLVLLDEPDLSREDERFPTTLNLLRRVTARGGSVLVTTHRIQTILEIADRVTILDNGRVRLTERSAALDQEAVLKLLDDPRKDVYPKLRALAGKPVLRLEALATRGGLNSLSLEVRGGEILGIAALTGDQRMWLPNALYGLDEVISGEIRLHGQRMRIPDPAAAVRLGIGYLSEDRVAWGLQSGFAVPENITLSNLGKIRVRGLLRRREELRVARGYVRRFNIRVRSLSDKVSTLSTGNQQKVLLSRWLFSNCRILILEEPTKNIDGPSRNEIYNFMNAYVQRGGTLLIASSDIDEMVGMCDRVLAFRAGAPRVFARPEMTKSAVFSYIAGKPQRD